MTNPNQHAIMHVKTTILSLNPQPKAKPKATQGSTADGYISSGGSSYVKLGGW